MSDLTAVPCVQQVPDNLPLVVKQRRVGKAVFYGVLTVVVCVVFAVGFPEVIAESTSVADRTFGISFLSVFAVVLFALLLLLWLRAFAFPPFRGPVLAVDSGGVWMRRVMLARFAVYVPWSAVRKIDTQKALGGHLLRIEVDPTFPWPPNSLKGPRAIVLAANKGPGLLQQVKVNDPAQLLEQLTELSGGRVPIG
jgi:hypothetical protein